MNSIPTLRRMLSLWPLATIIVALMSINAVRASAACCDLVIDVDPDVNCCLTVNGSEWSDMGRPDTDGPYCGGGGTIMHVACPATLLWVSIQTTSGPITIPFGTVNRFVELKEGCCVLISLDQSWPAAPCNYLHIRHTDCRS